MHEILNHIEQIVKRLDYIIAFGHFGSSRFLQEFNDLDILLISERSYETVSPNHVDLLHYYYVKGERKHIYTPCSRLIKLFKSQHKTICQAYDLRFVLGPIYESMNKNKVDIHVKGLISIDTLNYFIKKFPFHGISIINSTHWLYRNKELDIITPELTYSDYIFHVEILRKRFEKCQNENCQNKILRKINIMNCIFTKKSIDFSYDFLLNLDMNDKQNKNKLFDEFVLG